MARNMVMVSDTTMMARNTKGNGKMTNKKVSEDFLILMEAKHMKVNGKMDHSMDKVCIFTQLE